MAAARVGPGGKAIGIDMTPEMIELARRNAAVDSGADLNALHPAFGDVPEVSCSVRQSTGPAALPSAVRLLISAVISNNASCNAQLSGQAAA